MDFDAAEKEYNDSTNRGIYNAWKVVSAKFTQRMKSMEYPQKFKDKGTGGFPQFGQHELYQEWSSLQEPTKSGMNYEAPE